MRSIRIPEPPFLLEIQPVTLLGALDQNPEEREQELQVLFRRLQRERIDREIARFLADIEIASAKDVASATRKLPPMSKMYVCG